MHPWVQGMGSPGGDQGRHRLQGGVGREEPVPHLLQRRARAFALLPLTLSLFLKDLIDRKSVV